MTIFSIGGKDKMCNTLVLKENAMLKARPELMDEWDFERNDELGFNVYEMTKGSSKKVWWICPKCKSPYDSTVANRVNGRGCPYCRGLKVNHTNSLASLYPKLAKEWNTSKNGNLSPHDFTVGNDSEKVWWKGACGHEWDSIIRSRVSGSGCPYCPHNPKTLKGFNDLWTTHPQIASWLFDTEEGHKYSKGSSKKLDWKCPNCNFISKNKTPQFIVGNGYIPCPNCSDGFSFSEKVIYNLLIDNDIDFEIQKIFKWAEEYRYDFYIPELNWIVEAHGLQHYEEVKFNYSNNRGLKYQTEKDRKKEELAWKNGIKEYVVVDCRISDINYIVDSTMNTILRKLVDKINIQSIEQRAYKSIVISACEIWNKGNGSNDIALELKIHPTTAIRYLKKGLKMGFCNYSSKESGIRNRLKTGNIKQIAQLDKNRNLIKMWDTLSEIEKKLNINSDYVSQCCKGKRDEFKGCIWEYAENYYRKLEV